MQIAKPDPVVFRGMKDADSDAAQGVALCMREAKSRTFFD